MNVLLMLTLDVLMKLGPPIDDKTESLGSKRSLELLLWSVSLSIFNSVMCFSIIGCRISNLCASLSFCRSKLRHEVKKA